MTDPFSTEQPVEDVLEQRRVDDPEECDDRATADRPMETNDADFDEQQIVVPLEDDRYPDG